MPPDPLLEVDSLSISFATDAGRTRVVEEVSFAIRSGETVGLVGESGCGKSVPAMSIMRLNPSPPSHLDAGRILFQGNDLLDLDSSEMRAIRGDRIGMVFQEPMTSLNPTFSIGYQIAEVFRIHRRMSAAEARRESIDILGMVGIGAAGGWLPLMDQLQQIDPALLLPMGVHGFSVTGVLSALSFLGIGLAFLGVPQLLVRFMAAKDEQEIVSGSLIAVLCIIIFDIGAVFSGMAGRALFPGLDDPETVMPLMSTDLFPAFITGLFVVVVLGAIMSTVDSLLILASSAVVRDLIQKVFRPDFSERRLSRYGKWTTVVLGLLAIPFALAEVQVIFWFVLFAWSGLATAFAPVVLCALFWKRATLPGALAGMAGGFLTTVIWVVAFKAQFYDLYEMLPGFFVGAALTILVSLYTTPPEGVEAEFESIKRAVGSPFKRQGR